MLGRRAHHGLEFTFSDRGPCWVGVLQPTPELVRYFYAAVLRWAFGEVREDGSCVAALKGWKVARVGPAPSLPSPSAGHDGAAETGSLGSAA